MQIAIDEDGSANPPRLPPGTIVRMAVGPDRVDYYIVRLDHPVKSIRATNGKEWTLNDLAIAPSFQGDSLEHLRSRFRRGDTPIGIANLISPLDPDDPLLDFSKGEYFARGTVRRA